MAGLYDRMRPEGPPTGPVNPSPPPDNFNNRNDRVNVHLIAEAISAYVGNVFSRQQVIDAVNQDLANRGAIPLRPEDLTDLDNIADEIDSKASNTAKIIYGFCSMTPVFIAAELGLIPEAQWRGALGIP